MGKIVGNVLSFGLVTGLLAGCGTPVKNLPDSPPPTRNAPTTSAPDAPPDATPAKTPPSSSGNPKSYVVFGKRYHVMPSSEGFQERGIASWYGPKFHGKKTSSGVPFDMHEMTAAHKSLPIPTYVRVTHVENGRSIVVKVNDRGPFSGKRVIDLSYAAAKKLGMVESGTAAVEVIALPPYQYLAGATPKPARPQPAPSVALTQANATPPATTPRPVTVSSDGRTGGTSLSVADAQSQPALPPLALQTSYHNPSAERSAPGTSEISRQPVPTAPVADIEPVYMQVGAFSQRRNAEQLQHQLAGRVNHPVQISSNAGELHKVLIGPLSHHSEADGLTLKLASLGVGSPHLVYE